MAAADEYLLAVNGLPQLAAAILLFKKNRFAPYAVLACGIILMLWIVLEWWVWGFNAICNIYFVLGLAETVLAVISIKRKSHDEDKIFMKAISQ